MRKKNVTTDVVILETDFRHFVMDLGSAIRLAKQQNNMLYLDEILERAKGMLERDTMTATEALEGYTCYLRDVVKQYEQNK